MINIKKVSINFDDNLNRTISFEISQEEKEIDIHIYANFKDDFNVCVINPNNKRTKFISQGVPTIRNQIENVKIKGEIYVFNESTNYRKIRIKLSPKNTEGKVWEGRWELLFVPKKEIRGTINVYIEYSSNFQVTKMNREIATYFDAIVGYAVAYKDKENFKKDLNNIAPTYKLIEISDNIGILFVDVNFQNMSSVEILKTVFAVNSIENIKELVPLSSLSIISQDVSNGINANEEIGANFIKNNPNVSLSGRGVLIGIIDTGIDYLHPDFIYQDNTSKIVSIWDQTKEGNVPEGFNIGSEYTREDINQAIINNDSSLSRDDVGSGTMLAGICAGMGNVNENYAGVAEEAELVVVKMTTINGRYDDVFLNAGFDYVLKKAIELRRPVVMNIGFGSNNRVGESNKLLNNTFFRNGICLVTAVGNEGNTDTHTSGRLLYNNDIEGIGIILDEDEEHVKVEIWINRPDVVKAAVVSPTGELTRDVDATNFNTVVGILDVESTIYSIRYIFPTIDSGQEQIVINLFNVRKGRWTIRLTGMYVTNGAYNAYLQNREFLKPGTRFVEPNSERTVNYPATLRDNITVGAYDIINNSIWEPSSRGNTINNIPKPDIVAPGVNIIAPFPGGGYATVTGTAPATAYTSGCVALLLQYTMVNGNYPNLGFVQKIRTYLRIGATRIDNVQYPNINSGYGILNIRETFNQLR